MAKYTVELREICESYVSPRTLDVEKIVDVARSKIFSFDYPIFDESYKPILEKKILLHNYTREISHETYGLWKLKLNTKLNEIMPFYNQLYESELLEFNPFYDTELNRTYDRKNEESGTTSANTKGSSKSVNIGSNNSIQDDFDNSLDVYSDTPQGSVANLESGTYLSNARKLKNDGGSTIENTSNETNDSSSDVENLGSRDITNLEEFLESVKGKQGGKSYSELLKEFRKTFINIDLMIIEELGEMFFTLW